MDTRKGDREINQHPENFHGTLLPMDFWTPPHFPEDRCGIGNIVNGTLRRRASDRGERGEAP